MSVFSKGTTVTDPPNPKTQAREIIEALPESATWEDLMYELYVRESIEKGLTDVENGRSIPHEEVRARLRELLRRAS
jgi:predicted transcriptional regulator